MDRRIVIAGAGSVGGFVGGLLCAAGRDVVFLARPRIAEELARHGLSLTGIGGLEHRLPASALRIETDPAAALAGADIILVTVKSGATATIGRSIADHAPPGATVVSLQNGLGNADALRAILPGRRVLAGMVPFNVAVAGPGRLHRGTTGDLMIEADADLVAALSVPDLPVTGHGDMPSVLAGKLLLNLNNALNALSGVTLHEELGNRRWRRLLAASQVEALAVFAATGIVPVSLGGLAVHRLPPLLRLPTPLFRLLTSRGIRIDRRARSSMLEDLERGRPTEIGELQGRIVALADQAGLAVPVNRRVLAAIRAAEAVGTGSPRLDPRALLSATS